MRLAASSILEVGGGVATNAGIKRFLTIHRFGHRLGRGERSGGLSTAKFHIVSARILLTVCKTHKYKMPPQLLGRIGSGDEDGMELNLDGQTWCFKLPPWQLKTPPRLTI